jgi:hypothetical protein
MVRLCANYARENVCNWAVAADAPDSLCTSCRLTRVIPDLGRPGNREAWYRLEVAKRRLVYSLVALGCPLASKRDDPARGLAFEFLADPPPGGAPVLTGHRGGVITLGLAEADDAVRERRRLELGEPYRTLLGHFRHEIGHYYWDRLISGSAGARFRSAGRGLVLAHLRAEQPEPRARAAGRVPFVLSPPAVEKLRFVHETVRAASPP